MRIDTTITTILPLSFKLKLKKLLPIGSKTTTTGSDVVVKWCV